MGLAHIIVTIQMGTSELFDSAIGFLPPCQVGCSPPKLNTFEGYNLMATKQKKTGDGGASGAFLPTTTAVERTSLRLLESTNPLRGLTALDIDNVLDFSLGGCISRLQLIYDRLEASSLDLAAVLMRRESALTGCDWEIRRRTGRDGMDEALAGEQEAMLSEQFNRAEDSGELIDAIQALQLAKFRGLAVVQPRYDDDGLAGFDAFDQWNFALDPQTHDLYWNPSGMDRLDYRTALKRVPADSVIVNLERRPVDGLALPIYVRQTLGEDGWAKFMSRRGLPSCYIIGPGSLGNLTMDDFATAAKKVADGGSGALPNGSQVVTEQMNPGTSNGFDLFLAHQQKLIVLAATGGILGSLAEATGLGSGVADSHDKTWKQIISADAMKISGLIQRSVGARLLDTYFPGKPRLAYFAINSDTPATAAEVLDCVVKARQAGLTVDPEQITEMTGFRFVTGPNDDNAQQGLEDDRGEPTEGVEGAEAAMGAEAQEGATEADGSSAGLPGGQATVENTARDMEPTAGPEGRMAEGVDEAGQGGSGGLDPAELNKVGSNDDKVAAGTRLLKGFDLFLAPLKAILSRLAKARDDDEAMQLVEDAKARIANMEAQDENEFQAAVQDYYDNIGNTEKENKDEQEA